MGLQSGQVGGLGGFSGNGGAGSGYTAPMPRGYSAPTNSTGGGGQGKGVRAKRDIGMPSRLSHRKFGRGR